MFSTEINNDYNTVIPLTYPPDQEIVNVSRANIARSYVAENKLQINGTKPNEFTIEQLAMLSCTHTDTIINHCRTRLLKPKHSKIDWQTTAFKLTLAEKFRLLVSEANHFWDTFTYEHTDVIRPKGYQVYKPPPNIPGSFVWRISPCKSTTVQAVIDMKNNESANLEHILRNHFIRNGMAVFFQQMMKAF